MHSVKKLYCLGLFWLYFGIVAFGQSYQSQLLTDENGFNYHIVTGDPTQTRIYTLKNGLKVYLSVYKDKPRIQTFIAVKAGSKNDPKTATGLAHYLEHLVFKGTSKIGAKDYDKEKILLDSIESLFEKYRKTKDPIKRKSIYKVIDQTSKDASKLAIANEYDRLLSIIGAKGTNAYTWHEQTVYVNDIPANQLKKWLLIERERFSEVVPRLFHTELEAVYEEKNGGLDDDGEKVNETLMASLFKKHQYGTQTTIGTIDHLKNPSITEIKKYFNTYYVPNNMAICMSGDLDPAQTIQWISETFGKMPVKNVPHFVPAKEDPIVAPIIKKVIGPEEESITIGFRFPGNSSREALMMNMVDMILSNSQAGLIDLNLNQRQKLLNGYSSATALKDYSIHQLGGSPRKGQTLEQVKTLLLAQLDSVRKGRFDESLIPAIVNNLKISKIQSYESNGARASAQVDAFIKGEEWIDVVTELDKLGRITKSEIMEFARKSYGSNYVAVFKLTGKDPNVKKVEKPQITPVELNRGQESAFFKEMASIQPAEIEPMFLDYSKDLSVSDLKPGIKLLYKKNDENELFKMNYLLEMGNNHNPEIGLAIQYLEFCGTSQYPAEALKKEFFKLGTSFNVFASDDRIYVSLTGLQSNFEKSVQLFESLLNNPVGDAKALQNMVADILKERQNQKLDKRSIMWGGLNNYAQYGPKSPFTNILSSAQLSALKPEKLIETVKSLKSYEHHILFYGPSELDQTRQWLLALHSTPETLKPIPPPIAFEQKETESVVYWVNYDMVQAELLFGSKSVPYSQDLVPVATLFNEYFGGDMSSVVFQELRESKALAYTAFAQYNLARDKSKNNFVSGYIGTQADKLTEATTSMKEILENMPENENSIKAAQNAILTRYKSERITKSNILFNYENAIKLGLNEDPRKNIYEKVKTMTLADIKNFHQSYIKGKKFSVCVLGSKSKLDFSALAKYGKVVELKLEDIFGY